MILRRSLDIVQWWLNSRSTGDRSVRAWILFILLSVALVLTAISSLSVGATDTALYDFGLLWLSGKEIPLRDHVIMLDIRLPRVLLGMIIGACLSVSGALMQGLFRNPLADPGLVGISSGAAFGAVVAIVLGGLLPAFVLATIGTYLIPIAAFLGGWFTTILLYRVATRSGRTSVAVMLLAGIALSALAAALTGLLIFHADDQQLRDFTFWSLGSLAGATWTKLLVSSPFFILGAIFVPSLAKSLNALALGEASAMHLGIPLQKVKTLCILSVASLVGASVAISGGIGFIGIVVPHLLRLVIGPDHRYLLPNAAVLGAIILLIADMISRTIVAPAELPIGIVTAIIGGPFFIYILLKNRTVLDL